MTDDRFTPAQRAQIETVLSKYRNTEPFQKAQASFKTILRKYVHGGIVAKDQDLEADFEMLLTLKESEIDQVLGAQNIVDNASKDLYDRPAGAVPVEGDFYTINSFHHHSDVYFTQLKENDAPVVGVTNASQRMEAKFSAAVLFQRFPCSQTQWPERAKQEGFKDTTLTSWQDMVDALTNKDGTAFDAAFNLVEETQKLEVLAVTQKMDWTTACGDYYTAPTQFDKSPFSPALFSVITLHQNADDRFNVFVVISADASGSPKSAFTGLIGTTDEFLSTARTRFTFTSQSDNATNAAVTLDPLTLHVSSGFPYGSDSSAQPHLQIPKPQPYLRVEAVFEPISPPHQSIFDPFGLTGHIHKLLMMLRKGAYMHDLIKIYYPDMSAIDVWANVALAPGSDMGKLKKDLIGLGLGIADGTYERLCKNLWIMEPTIIPTN